MLSLLGGVFRLSIRGLALPDINTPFVRNQSIDRGRVITYMCTIKSSSLSTSLWCHIFLTLVATSILISFAGLKVAESAANSKEGINHRWFRCCPTLFPFLTRIRWCFIFSNFIHTAQFLRCREARRTCHPWHALESRKASRRCSTMIIVSTRRIKCLFRHLIESLSYLFVITSSGLFPSFGSCPTVLIRLH